RSRGAQVEGTDPRPAQRGEMPADAEGGADVTGQRADVGARGASHFGVDIEHAELPVGSEGGRLEPADCDTTGSEHDVLTRPCTGVRAHAGDLDGTDGGRALLDLAGKGFHRRDDVGGGELIGPSVGERLTLSIVSRRRYPEAHRRSIVLVVQGEMAE